MKKSIELFIVVLVFIGFYYSGNDIEIRGNNPETLIDSLLLSPSYQDNSHDTVLATKYSPTVYKGNNLITADGSKIKVHKLNSYDLKWIAISRDLLDRYSMGDTIIVTSPNENLNGEWIIKDLMPRRWKNKIDFLVPSKDNYNFHNPHHVIIRKKESIGT